MCSVLCVLLLLSRQFIIVIRVTVALLLVTRDCGGPGKRKSNLETGIYLLSTGKTGENEIGLLCIRIKE